MKEIQISQQTADAIIKNLNKYFVGFLGATDLYEQVQKEILSFVNKEEPRGREFYDKATGRLMLLVEDERYSFSGWLCYKHLDGQWVTVRKATENDIREINSILDEADDR